MGIAVLITCYNRREMTMRCLRLLTPQLGDGDDVYLVDDGCTDGTAVAVREAFPRVRVISSGGGCFWAKGMALAWQGALEQEHDADVYTGYLWLNDDIVLKADALSGLRSVSATYPDSVVVGEFVNACGERVYGTHGELFAGNFVFVPRKVYEKVGLIDGGFQHAWADSDYALRCKRAGVSVVSGGLVGSCEGHPLRPSLKGLGLRARWSLLWNPKGWCLHDLWRYRRRNWGVCVAIVSSVHFMVHVLMGERT